MAACPRVKDQQWRSWLVALRKYGTTKTPCAAEGKNLQPRTNDIEIFLAS